MFANNDFLYARLDPRDAGMFRFLLEGYANLAYATTLDRREALLKVCFAPGQKADVAAALAQMRASLDFAVFEPPASIK